MVDQIAVVTFTTPSSGAPSSLLSITHPSITEAFSAAIFLVGGTDDNTNLVHGSGGIGFCAPDGAADPNACMGWGAEDGLTAAPAPDTGTTHSLGVGADCIRVANPTNIGAAELVRAQYNASVAGGVQLNFLARTVQVRVTAILFAGLARAHTNGAASSTVGESESVGDTTNFEPDLVIFAASDASLNTDKRDASPNIGFGVNDGNSPPQQVCAYINAADENDPNDADGILLDDAAYVHNPGGTLVRAATLTVEYSQIDQFTSSGFDHTSNAGTPDALYLALKFSGNVRIACAQMGYSASTGEQAFNDFGFTPDVVLGMLTAITTIGSQVDGATASASGYFVTGRYATRGYTWHHEEGFTASPGSPTNAGTRSEDNILLYDHTGGISARAGWVGGSGSGGFLLDFQTAAAAGTLTALGIQLSPSTAKASPQQSRATRGVHVAKAVRWAAGRAKRGLPLRLLAFWDRQRRALADRLRPQAKHRTAMVPELGAVLEEHPTGVVVRAGLLRGAVVGPGVGRDDEEA